MMRANYLFLYVSVFFSLLLSFPLSSAHFKPPPDFSRKLFTISPPPCDNDTTVNPPGKTGTPTTPPGDKEYPPSDNITPPPDSDESPPVDDEKEENDDNTPATNPPGNSNTPTTPPGSFQTPNTHTTPPGNNEDPTTPPANNSNPNSPSGSGKNPNDDDSNVLPGSRKNPNSPPGNDNNPNSPPGSGKNPKDDDSNVLPGSRKNPKSPPGNDNNPNSPPGSGKNPNSDDFNSLPGRGKNPSSPPGNGKNPNSTPGNGDEPHASFKDCFSKVYAFGDSFTDTGNAHSLGGLKPSVDSIISNFLKGPSGNNKLPGFRQSNGRLMVDFLCENLGLPYVPPFKQDSADFSSGANFAIGGSTALASEFFDSHEKSNSLMWKGTPMSFQKEVDWFHKYVDDIACKGKDENACKAEMGNALFWIGDMGGDDYARILGSSGSPFSIRSLAETTCGQVTKLLSQLLEKGAKYIVVQGVPPMGCCPLELLLCKSSERDANGCSSTANGVIKSHNDLLIKSLNELQKRYPDCTILYADVWGAFLNILQNHQKFHFSEPFQACCGAGGGPYNFKLHSLCGSMGTSTCKEPANHIFWDGVHFTEAMSKALSELIIKGSGFTSPTSFEDLVKLKLGLRNKAAEAIGTGLGAGGGIGGGASGGAGGGIGGGGGGGASGGAGHGIGGSTGGGGGGGTGGGTDGGAGSGIGGGAGNIIGDGIAAFLPKP